MWDGLLIHVYLILKPCYKNKRESGIYSGFESLLIVGIFKLFLLMMILIAVIILNRGGVLILCLPDFCQDFEKNFDSQVVSGYSGYTPSKKCLWKKKCLITVIKMALIKH